MSVPWTQQVDELVTSALVLARSRQGRIAALLIAVPPELPRDQVGQLLGSRLAACGHPGLEIATHPAQGAMRITRAEFER
jgi:hypothetical protein